MHAPRRCDRTSRADKRQTTTTSSHNHNHDDIDTEYNDQIMIMIESPTTCGGVGNTNNNINNESSSSTIADGGIGGMTIAAHTIHTAITSTIADGLLHTIAHWKILLLGQCISILVAIAGGTNDVLALECGVSAPSTYNALGYALVAMVGFIQLSRAKGSNTSRNSDNNNNDETDRAESEQERTSFREGSGSSFVGDLRHLDHDHHDGNDEDFDYDDDDDEDDDELDDLTLDDSITKRSSFFFSLRRNSNNNHDNTDKQFHQDTRRERYPPPPPPPTHNNRSISAANSVKNKHHIHVNATNLPYAKWYYYFTIAFVEAQAFYFIFLAFRYTSFTFVYVSDALAIPSAMIFSRLFMKRKYLRTHVLGCLICITGIVVNTASDISNDAKENNAGGGGGLSDVVASLDHVKGDIFAILGAILLGLDDVLSEMILDNYGGGVSKMLFMKGIFGTLISLVQLGIFERENVYLLFGVDDSIEASSSYPCELPWRMTLLTAHVTSRALGVAGEMQFLFISEA